VIDRFFETKQQALTGQAGILIFMLV